MKAICLASSSSGNCYIFQFNHKDTTSTIMVECGIPYKDIIRKCNDNGIRLSSIQACIITHAHSDHCKSAKNLERIGIPIYAHKDTLDMINVQGHELTPNKVECVLKEGLYVFPFLVNHDINGAMGFIFKTQNDTILFVNDSKTWDTNLINFKPNIIFIECNYDDKMVYAQYHELQKKLNNSSQYADDEVKEMHTKLKQHERNINAHMSLRGTIKNLGKVDLAHCQGIMLMHLSDRYANEYKMKQTIQNTYGIRTYVCGKNGGIK